MTGFEPRTSCIGSNRSANWTTPLPDCFSQVAAMKLLKSIENQEKSLLDS